MKDNKDMKRLLISLFVVGAVLVFDPNLLGEAQNVIFPPSHVHTEALIKPVKVEGWSEKGLLLTDGRVVLPAGMTSLPRESEVLRLATQRGVDVLASGQVYGQLKVHHGCGNDPIRQDTRRVDLTDLLAYYGEGEFVTAPDERIREFPPHKEFYRDAFEIDYLKPFQLFQDAYHMQVSEAKSAKVKSHGRSVPL